MPPAAVPPAAVLPVSVQPAATQPTVVLPTTVQPAAVQPADVQAVTPAPDGIQPRVGDQPEEDSDRRLVALWFRLKLGRSSYGLFRI